MYRKLKVEFYLKEDGTAPAIKFLESLPILAQVKLNALIDRLETHGVIHDKTKFRLVDKRE